MKKHNILHYLVPEIISLKQCKDLFKKKKKKPPPTKKPKPCALTKGWWRWTMHQYCTATAPHYLSNLFIQEGKLKWPIRKERFKDKCEALSLASEGLRGAKGINKL